MCWYKQSQKNNPLWEKSDSHWDVLKHNGKEFRWGKPDVATPLSDHEREIIQEYLRNQHMAPNDYERFKFVPDSKRTHQAEGSKVLNWQDPHIEIGPGWESHIGLDKGSSQVITHEVGHEFAHRYGESREELVYFWKKYNAKSFEITPEEQQATGYERFGIFGAHPGEFTAEVYSRFVDPASTPLMQNTCRISMNGLLNLQKN